MKIRYLLFFIIITIQVTWAQNDPFAPKIDMNLLAETKWRYTYTLQVEANTIIHKAEKDYRYFLYLKYDFSYENFLNGTLSKGLWSINANELFYNFRNIKKFIVYELSPNALVLEFVQPNSKGTYQYHFIRVESKDAPFQKPSNELPEVKIEAALAQQTSKLRALLGKIYSKKVKNEQPIVAAPPQPHISIELVGGGFYGGIDPVSRDYIYIKPNGRLIKEFKSANNDLMTFKRDVPREDLEKFMEYIISKRFFEMDRLYDCNSLSCETRKRREPTPIPLRLAIGYGSRKKVITISIWGRDKQGIQYVEYPPALDEIIKYIQKLANDALPS